MLFIEIFNEQQDFTVSNLHMAFLSSVSELEIGNAVNHFIKLRYFKLVPNAKKFSYLRYLEPDSAHLKL